jgi:hypothetical protein
MRAKEMTPRASHAQICRLRNAGAEFDASHDSSSDLERERIAGLAST